MMKRCICLAAVLLGVSLMLQGCRLLPEMPKTQVSTSKMVLQISVVSLPEDEKQARIYTEPEKIKAVLDYIQGLQLEENYSNEPESSGGATRCITVYYAGGKNQIYYMAGEEYLRAGDEAWMCVKEEPEKALDEILQENSTDTVEQEAS